MPNSAELLAVLNTTNLQKNDPRLYQVLASLCRNLLALENATASTVIPSTGNFVDTPGLSGAGQLVKSTGIRTIEDADLSGDISTAGGTATTLSSTGVTPGSYGDATHVGQFTVDAKGRLSIAADVAITFPAGGITQLTGDVTAGPGSGSQVATLSNTGVAAGSYTNTSLTVDAKGRLTAASSGSAALDYVVMSDGAIPPSPMTDGIGNFIYVTYTP